MSPAAPTDSPSNSSKKTKRKTKEGARRPAKSPPTPIAGETKSKKAEGVSEPTTTDGETKPSEKMTKSTDGSDKPATTTVANGAPDSTPAGTNPSNSTPTPDATPPADMPAPTAEELASLGAALKEVREAVEKQRFEAARTQLKKAEGIAKLPEHKKVVERTRELTHYAAEFRKGLDRAIKELQPADNIQVGSSTFVGVVNSTPDRITLRVAGSNKTYALNNLPWALALAIADTWFDQNEPSTFAAKGAYLMTLPKADNHARAKARELWKSASDGGIETAGMEQAVEDKYEFATNDS